MVKLLIMKSGLIYFGSGAKICSPTIICCHNFIGMQSEITSLMVIYMSISLMSHGLPMTGGIFRYVLMIKPFNFSAKDLTEHSLIAVKPPKYT